MARDFVYPIVNSGLNSAVREDVADVRPNRRWGSGDEYESIGPPRIIIRPVWTPDLPIDIPDVWVGASWRTARWSVVFPMVGSWVHIALRPRRGLIDWEVCNGRAPFNFKAPRLGRMPFSVRNRRIARRYFSRRCDGGAGKMNTATLPQTVPKSQTARAILNVDQIRAGSIRPSTSRRRARSNRPTSRLRG